MNGLKQSYGFFRDEWMFTNYRPETDTLDYDLLNSILAKDLKSDWRIVTPQEF
jgi:hypothetical protein